MATLTSFRTSRRAILRLGGALAAVGLVGRGATTTHAAAGTTTLLAVGIDTIPVSPFVWRLVRDTAPTFGDGETLERALGFVYSPDGRMRLSADVPNGSGVIFTGRAAFIPEAIFQRQESLEGSPLSYLRIGLVPPEDADYGAGGEVIFDSDGGALRFTAPAGRRALRLYRVDLPPQGEVDLPQTDAPVLLHVLSGAAGIVSASGGDASALTAGRTVLAGRDGQDAGSVVLRSDSGASLLMAVIGEEVPANGTGQISFAFFDCPGGFGTCDQTDAIPISLEGLGVSLTQDDLASAEGDLVTPPLPYGTYALGVANDFHVELIPADEGTFGPPDGNTQLYYPVTLTPANPSVGIIITQGL